MNDIKGTGVALITPFYNDFSIDYNGLENLLHHVIGGGVDYLVLMGTTGESVTLSSDEKKKVIDFCKKVNNNRLPIVLGIGGNNTSAVVDEIKHTDFDGIDAILSVSPYYNKPRQEGIYLHYKMISEQSPLPIILYNVPGRTASNILADTTIRLANDFPNIVAIKEASGDIDQINKIIRNKPLDFIVLSGDDDLTLRMIKDGAEGVISVIGQSHPKEFSNMVTEGREGNYEESDKIHNNLCSFYDPLYADGNPAGIKAMLKILGICNDTLRPPLVNVRTSTYEELDQLNSKFNG